MTPNSAFVLRNPEATGPVVLSVPHGGRDYPPSLRAMLRPPVERIQALEDRLVDTLAGHVKHAPILVANAPRLWIDLNRHPAEIDPGLVDGIIASRAMLTPKLRSGLGLIPRRLAGVGELWRERLTLADVESRIATVHRPYHAAVDRLLQRSLHTHGVAVLIDLHSMPPLADATAKVVVGNRFGQTAGSWVSGRVAASCTRFGLGLRENSPYPGGHIVERHGAPHRGVHAVQIEVDRSLYLDEGLDQHDHAGLSRMQAWLTNLIDDLTDGAFETALPQAAE